MGWSKLSLDSLDGVRSVLENSYDISLMTFEEINQGYSNLHFFFIDANRNKYIARISNPAKKDNDFIIEEYVLFHLSLLSNGCQIPILIRNNTNELYTPIQDNSHLRVHLFKYIEGETTYLWWEVPSKEHLLSIVSNYKLLNNRLMSVPCNNTSFFTNRYYDTLELLGEKHWISKQIVKNELEGNLNRFIRCAFLILKQAEGILEGYDRQFVHGDIQLENILFLNDEVSGIIDFEFAEFGYEVVDVVFSAFRICKSGREDSSYLLINREMFNLFIKSYYADSMDTYNEITRNYSFWLAFFALQQSLLYLNNAVKGSWILDYNIGFLPCYNTLIAYKD